MLAKMIPMRCLDQTESKLLYGSWSQDTPFSCYLANPSKNTEKLEDNDEHMEDSNAGKDDANEILGSN